MWIAPRAFSLIRILYRCRRRVHNGKVRSKWMYKIPIRQVAQIRASRRALQVRFYEHVVYKITTYYTSLKLAHTLQLSMTIIFYHRRDEQLSIIASKESAGEMSFRALQNINVI